MITTQPVPLHKQIISHTRLICFIFQNMLNSELTHCKKKPDSVEDNWLAWKNPRLHFTGWLMIFLYLNSTRTISLESFLYIWQPCDEPYQTLCHFTSWRCISLCVHRLRCIKTGEISLYGRHTSHSEYHVFKRRCGFFVLIKDVATDSGSVSWSVHAGSRTASLSCHSVSETSDIKVAGAA